MIFPLHFPNFFCPFCTFHVFMISLSQNSLGIAVALSTSPDLHYIAKLGKKIIPRISSSQPMWKTETQITASEIAGQSPQCHLFDHLCFSRLDSGRALGGKHFLNKQDIYWPYVFTYYHLSVIHSHSGQITNQFSASCLASWVLYQAPWVYMVEECSANQIGI